MRRTLWNPVRKTAAWPTVLLMGIVVLLAAMAARASGPAVAVAGTLPPLPLLGMEFVCGVLLLDRYAGRCRRNRPWSSLFDALGLAALMTAGSLFFWGSPHASGVAALAGKFATGLFTLSSPLLLLTLVIQLCRMQTCSRVFTWFLGLTFCLLGSVNLLFVGTALACGVTGECQ